MPGLYRVKCVSCDYRATVDSAGRLRWLQRLGHLRRVSDPNSELVDAIFESLRLQLSCPECLTAVTCWEPMQFQASRGETITEDDPEFWGEGRRCAQCGKAISGDRLAALPTTRLCIACAQSESCAAACSSLSDETCPRCGHWLHWLSKRSSLDRFSLNCPECGFSSHSARDRH